MTAKKPFSVCKLCGAQYAPRKGHVYCSLLCTFEAKFKRSENGCWEWTHSINSVGYGQINVGRRPRAASRIAYILYKGNVPKGMLVLHKCDNRICVNPDHLFLGTHADNSLDMVIKNRDKRRKLTDAQVLEIRSAYKSGRNMRSIAAEYGITKQNVGHIVRGTTFRHL